MVRYALLLRGVNVGGRRRLAMTDLRAALESVGYGDVSTYLQSGNAVVRAGEVDPRKVEVVVRAAVAEATGIDTDVMARRGEDLAAVIASNPFPEAVKEPTRLHVAFLAEPVEVARIVGLDPATWAPDEFALGEREVYLRYGRSPGRSPLGVQLAKRLGAVATARNWTTVAALAELTS